MPSDLYTRYMRAASALRAHDKDCPPCAAGQRCPAGVRLNESFDRLFDAYINSLNNRR